MLVIWRSKGRGSGTGTARATRGRSYYRRRLRTHGRRCHSGERLLLGEHVPDRFGKLARHLQAAPATRAGRHLAYREH